MGKIITYISDGTREISKEEIKMLEEAEKTPIVYDEDSPEFSIEELKMMAEAAKLKKQPKQVVALRVSAETLMRAKATGRGYTGFLSRLLDNAIKDPKLVEKSL